MNRTIFIALTISLGLAALPAGAQVEYDPEYVSEDFLSEPLPPPPSEPQMPKPTLVKDPRPLPEKDWTVLLFMNANNNLSELGMFNVAAEHIAAMKKAGSSASLNIVAEYGSRGKPVRRALITKLPEGDAIYGEYPGADMGDHARVTDFIKWGKAFFPAKHYLVVLWNHGKGWIDPVMEKSAQPYSNKGILFDTESKNFVRTRQLGEIFRQAGYVDILAMNACLMQMAEVDYEIKDHVGLIIASEESVPTEGFDYEKILSFMNAGKNVTTESISGVFMSSYANAYKNKGLALTLSAVRAKALNKLPAHLSAMAGAIMQNNETDAARNAIAHAIRFTGLEPGKDPQKMRAPYADLYDFARIVAKKARHKETKAAAENLMGFLGSELVAGKTGFNSDAANGYDYSDTGGIAINMTMKEGSMPVFENKYSDLKLSKDSVWDEFLEWTDKLWSTPRY